MEGIHPHQEAYYEKHMATELDHDKDVGSMLTNGPGKDQDL
jgi:hypothetical protein